MSTGARHEQTRVRKGSERPSRNVKPNKAANAATSWERLYPERSECASSEGTRSKGKAQMVTLPDHIDNSLSISARFVCS